MTYQLEWTKCGVHKLYSGRVIFQDIYNSEREIADNSRFDDLRYILIDLLDIQEITMSLPEKNVLIAQRIGASKTNPLIKYAYVSINPIFQNAVLDDIRKGKARYAQRMFPTVSEAMNWAVSP